jgi:DNA-binding IclR family transcriptional regulator
VAAPVLDPEGRSALAVSVSGPVGRFRPEAHADAIRAAATGLANQLTRRRLFPTPGLL